MKADHFHCFGHGIASQKATRGSIDCPSFGEAGIVSLRWTLISIDRCSLFCGLLIAPAHALEREVKALLACEDVVS
jgi:hypothetical protein